MTSRPRLLVLAACLLLAKSGLAAALTWAQCAREAADHNAQIKVSAENVHQAHNNYLASLGSFMPSFSASIGQSQSGSYVADSFIGGDPGSTISLTVNQNLFAGFGTVAAITASRARLQNAEISLSVTAAETGYNLRSAFYQSLYAQQQVALGQEILKRRRENLSQVKRQVALGRDTEGSLLLTEANFLQARLDSVGHDDEVRTASLRLCEVLGREPANDLVVTGEFKSAAPLGPVPDVRRMAAELNQTHLALTRVESARAGVINARSVLLPRVNMSASITRSGTQISPQTGSWGVGLNLSYEFFTGGSTLWQVDTAQSVLLQAELEYGSVLRQQAAQLKTDYIAYSNSAVQNQISRTFLKAAQARATLARQQYGDGLLEFNDWDTIETELIARQRTALLGGRDAGIAKAGWERSQGMAFDW